MTFKSQQTNCKSLKYKLTPIMQMSNRIKQSIFLLLFFFFLCSFFFCVNQASCVRLPRHTGHHFRDSVCKFSVGLGLHHEQTAWPQWEISVFLKDATTKHQIRALQQQQLIYACAINDNNIHYTLTVIVLTRKTADQKRPCGLLVTDTLILITAQCCEHE